ncbi:zinc ribbon domain-containing protein [Clostridium botulinum]|nr:zinc ribbon domain-containing protein [Clostridium botulinum]NFJ73707.1 zinc ribbon domain-containing protein [Clostridium botulinum]
MEGISKNEVYKILDAYDTKELARVFVEYMISIGVKKLDRRKKDKRNTYSVHGDCTNWNRVECYYHKDSTEYCSEDLDITLRKRAGYYLIIGRKGERAFERSYDSIVHYDEKLFNEIVQDHKKLFQMILSGM